MFLNHSDGPFSARASSYSCFFAHWRFTFSSRCPGAVQCSSMSSSLRCRCESVRVLFVCHPSLLLCFGNRFLLPSCTCHDLCSFGFLFSCLICKSRLRCVICRHKSCKV